MKARSTLFVEKGRGRFCDPSHGREPLQGVQRGRLANPTGTMGAYQIFRFLKASNRQSRKPLWIFLQHTPQHEDRRGVVVPELWEHLFENLRQLRDGCSAKQRIEDLDLNLASDVIQGVDYR